VANFGAVSSLSGAPATEPITAALALSDLRWYDIQIDALFPSSAAEYPGDSLVTLRRERAAAWVERLLVLQRRHEAGVAGPQLLPFALAAFRAGNDSLARRLIDQRLAALAAEPAEQSYVLNEAIGGITDLSIDSARLSQTLPLAVAYVDRLCALPATGYRTRNDSTIVAYRKYLAELAVVTAADATDRLTMVVTHAQRALDRVVSIAERGEVLRQFPYQVVMLAVERQRDAADLTKSFNARLSAMGMPSLNAQQARFEALGTPAPELAAHAWVNTADSLYQPIPRTHAFNDGAVHVLLIGTRENSDYVSVLDRVRRRFGSAVAPLYVTFTRGNSLYDLLTPEEEVRWLTTFYQQKRHLAAPIAIWAGPKGPKGYGMVPAPSTVADQFHIYPDGQTCVVIDRRGRIRAYQSVVRRTDEHRLMRLIAQLVAESAAQGAVVSADSTATH